MHICRRSNELLGFVASTPGVVAVITELWDLDGRPVASAVRHVRRTHAELPIIAFCRLTPHTARELVTLAAAGISAVALRDQENLGDLVRGAIRRETGSRLSEGA